MEFMTGNDHHFFGDFIGKWENSSSSLCTSAPSSELVLVETMEQQECTIGIPLRGILTLRGRTLPSEWDCGVCKCPNSQMGGRFASCQECEQPRVAEWQVNSEGNVVQPAVVVELPPGWQPDKKVEKHVMKPGELAALRGGKKAAAEKAAAAAAASSPEGDNDNGQPGEEEVKQTEVAEEREEEEEEEEEFDEEKDGGEQKSTYTYGIVTEVTRIRGRVFVYAFADDDIIDDTGNTPPVGAPVGGTLSRADVKELVVVDPGDE